MTRHCPNPTRKLVGNQQFPEERSSDRERQEYTHTMHRATCLKFPSSENVQLPDHNQTERTTSELYSTGTKKRTDFLLAGFPSEPFPYHRFYYRKNDGCNQKLQCRHYTQLITRVKKRGQFEEVFLKLSQKKHVTENRRISADNTEH